ncbi:MAG: hypothetical protein MZU91_06890 [Desulfosudis oleivorans]|nr:hypothetical protein [Desulfosudis oleivorans]
MKTVAGKLGRDLGKCETANRHSRRLRDQGPRAVPRPGQKGQPGVRRKNHGLAGPALRDRLRPGAGTGPGDRTLAEPLDADGEPRPRWPTRWRWP